jgi:hypothetical protein
MSLAKLEYFQTENILFSRSEKSCEFLDEMCWKTEILGVKIRLAFLLCEYIVKRYGKTEYNYEFWFTALFRLRVPGYLNPWSATWVRSI